MDNEEFPWGVGGEGRRPCSTEYLGRFIQAEEDLAYIDLEAGVQSLDLLQPSSVV